MPGGQVQHGVDTLEMAGPCAIGILEIGGDQRQAFAQLGPEQGVVRVQVDADQVFAPGLARQDGQGLAADLAGGAGDDDAGGRKGCSHVEGFRFRGSRGTG